MYEQIENKESELEKKKEKIKEIKYMPTTVWKKI